MPPARTNRWMDKRMAGNPYKSSGLLRAGYHYQDLVAIQVLVEFYRYRDRFHWVQVEAPDGAYSGIDDIVALRSDGQFDLTQVKFTGDPASEENRLDLDWLLKRKPKGTSLLKKWSARTLQHLGNGTLGAACLKTNRRPDDEFAAWLDGSKVDFAKVTRESRAKIVAEVGSEEDAELFFKNFDFRHSQSQPADLEDQLWTELSSDTDRPGFVLFREQVSVWATEKNQPAPDGCIRHIHLRQALSLARPRPLPQDFRIPQAYQVPDADFDTSLLQEAQDQSGVTVLWGPPGRGKSTYLSHCIARIPKTKALCVRHHYSIGPEASSLDRFHYQAIYRSIEDQIRRAIPDLSGPSDSLRSLLKSAAERLTVEKRRLIVIVDGLDHVWREGRSHDQLEQLFGEILPLPQNAHLVVGTQKIADQYLPSRLLAELPQDDWTELPPMSSAAVTQWVIAQDKGGRLNVGELPRQSRSRTVRAIGEAFFQISGGLPLHLIYSFESLARCGGPVTAAEVAALPACPDGDIRVYYRSLWQAVSPDVRAVLHVLAGLAFGPPPFAKSKCFGQLGSEDAFAQIGHLLEFREFDIRPFHSSVYAFVRDQAVHSAKFKEHAPAVSHWLEAEAPPYWRWAWLWITKAQLGDASDLIEQPDRAWATRALVAGYKIEQVIAILDEAERAALDRFDLPRLIVLRSLKTRALNGPEFQTHEWALFPQVAIATTSDPDARALLRSDLARMQTAELPFVVRSAPDSLVVRVADTAIKELNHRLTHKPEDEISGMDRVDIIVRAILDTVACLDETNIPRIVKFVGKSRDADALLSRYATTSLIAKRPENVLALAKKHSGRQFARPLFFALCLEGLRPGARIKGKNLSHSEIRALELVLGGTPAQSKADRDLAFAFKDDAGGPGFAADFRGMLRGVFLETLCDGLQGKFKPVSQMPPQAESTWFGQAIRKLELVATDMAVGWGRRKHGQHSTRFSVRSTFPHPRYIRLMIAADSSV